MENERTLTERISRIEKILAPLGLDETLQDEGDVRYAGVVSRDDYRGAQRARNYERSAGMNECAIQPSAFEGIMERIQAATDRVHRQAGKLEEIGNRVMGSLPESDTGKGGAEPAPTGTLDHTYKTLEWLDNGLARLEAAALRLERI